MKKFLYYLPRALALAIVGFFSLFVLEGFGPGFGWQDSVAHLAAALVILAMAILAWKRPKIGGWLFAALGLYFLQGISSAQWLNSLLIGGVPLLVGILFLIEGFAKKPIAS